MMTVEDVKNVSIGSLESMYKDGSWRCLSESSKGELLNRLIDSKVRNSGEWDTPIEEVFHTPKVQKMIKEGFFDDMEGYLIDE